MALDELNARFQIENGRMSTTSPMQIKSEEAT